MTVRILQFGTTGQLARELIAQAKDFDVEITALSRADAVVNLAGEPLFGKRWTAARRRALEESRIGVTQDVVRAIAVANATRLPALPEVPTSAELGLKDYESSAWFGLVAPRGTPKPMIQRLNAEVLAAMRDAAVRERFVDFGAEPLTSTPEELGRFISAEVVKWRGLIAARSASRSTESRSFSRSRAHASSEENRLSGRSASSNAENCDCPPGRR